MARPEHSTPRLQRRALLLAGAGWAVGARATDDEQPVVVMQPVTGGEIEVQFVPGFDAALRERALRWVRNGADAVAGYLGRFPVPQTELLLLPVDGDGVVSGVSFGVPSPLIARSCSAESKSRVAALRFSRIRSERVAMTT